MVRRHGSVQVECFGEHLQTFRTGCRGIGDLKLHNVANLARSGNRNGTGATAQARLMTIFRTAQQQKRDGVAFLIELMRTPAGYALPSLLPAP